MTASDTPGFESLRVLAMGYSGSPKAEFSLMIPSRDFDWPSTLLETEKSQLYFRDAR